MNTGEDILFDEMRRQRKWMVISLDTNGVKETRNPLDMSLASATDSNTWGSFDDAVQRVANGQAMGVRFQMVDDVFEDFSAEQLIEIFTPPLTDKNIILEDLATVKYSNPANWEQPILFDNIMLPSFPYQAFPPTLSNYGVAVSEATQTPIDLSCVSILAVCSLSVQGKYVVQAKPDWFEPLNLYSTVILKPAERKSSVLKHCTDVIVEFEQKWNQNNAAAISKSKLDKKLLLNEVESLTRLMLKDPSKYNDLLIKQAELDNFQEVKPLRLLADDASPEALTSLLADYKGRMSVVSSEGGLFETLAGRYSGNVNLDAILKAHSGDMIRVDRKGREPEFINKPSLTLLLTIQPAVLDGLFAKDAFVGRGLTARILYSMPTSHMGRRRYNTAPIPQQIRDGYNNLINILLSIPSGSQAEVLTLSPEAAALSEQFANWLEPKLDNEYESIQDWAGKLHGQIIRIAGILHLCQNFYLPTQIPISLDTFQNAISIGNYFLAHAQAAYGIMGSDKRAQGAKYLLKKLAQQNQLVFKRPYDIHRTCRRYTAEEIKPMLKLLEDMNYLKTVDGIVYLNPLYFCP